LSEKEPLRPNQSAKSCYRKIRVVHQKYIRPGDK
jgi:hypothetical protein